MTNMITMRDLMNVPTAGRRDPRGGALGADWATTIDDMGDTYYKLRPTLELFADHPILFTTIAVALVGTIVGIYGYIGAGMKSTGGLF